MELSGTLAENLRGAVKSAHRLKGHPVYRDTMTFWKALLAHAQQQQRLGATAGDDEIQMLIEQLQAALDAR